MADFKCVVAIIERMRAKLKGHQERSVAMMEASLETAEASQEKSEAKTEAYSERLEANQEKMKGSEEETEGGVEHYNRALCVKVTHMLTTLQGLASMFCPKILKKHHMRRPSMPLRTALGTNIWPQGTAIN
jgi:hypothetical protein